MERVPSSPHSFLSATLTSYSADSAAKREDATKYLGNGYHGSSLNHWQQEGQPVVASTSSTCMIAGQGPNKSSLYRTEDNMSVSTYSLNKLHPDRGPGSAYSSGSVHSITLNLLPRPNSVAGMICGCVWLMSCVSKHTHFPVREEMHHTFSTMVSSPVIVS